MNYTRLFFSLLCLSLVPCWLYAQDPNSGDDLDLDGSLVELFTRESGGTSLILDNSRTKIGRDFYDLFYKHWAALPVQSDTTQGMNAALVSTSPDIVIVVEEIPSPGTANQILVSIDDQPVWQQFVQARYDILEADALYALEVVRQYLATYQDTQQQLGGQDQKGSGVF